MTRELKIGLVLGVTLLLGIAILISDHLAVGRRPRLANDIATTPAMVPPPPVASPTPAPVRETSTEASAEPRLASASPKVEEPLAVITQRTGATDRAENRGLIPPSDAELDAGLRAEVAKRGGSIEGGKLNIPPAALVQRADAASFSSRTGTDVIRPWSTSEVNFDTPAADKTIQQIAGNTAAKQNGTSGSTGDTIQYYTVASGDSAYKIAKQFLGDGSKWKKLVDANPRAIGSDGQLKIGTKIIIPGQATASTATAKNTPAPKTTLVRLPANGGVDFPKASAADSKPDNKSSVKAVVAKAEAASYTVKAGDTLHGIAKRELGDARRASEIINLNKSVIKDPDSLPQGISLKLPVG